MAVQTQIQVRRGTASSWTSTNPTLAAGEIGFESDIGKIKVGNGSSTWNSLTYIGAANAIQYVYNASAGQTTFSGADANGATLAYTVGAEQVYVNGVLQVRGTDYTATNGTSVVLTTATIASDIVTVVAMGTFTVADTYTQAQANSVFPLNTSAFFAGKNKIINGDFGIWQRGTSFTTGNGAYVYTADRWRTYFYGSNTTSVTQQAFTPGTAPVAGYEGNYFLRVSSSNTQALLEQLIEDVRTFAGQTVTVSFWVKQNTANANSMAVSLVQNFGSGGSTYVTTGVGSSLATTTGWVRYSANVTVPSVSGKTIGAGSYLTFQIVSTSLNNALDIWGVQLEAGSVATAFQTATGTIQGELAACQRYYWRTQGNNVYSVHGISQAQSTTSLRSFITLPVTMRVIPTSIDFSTLRGVLYNVAGYAITAAALQTGDSSQQIATIDFTTSGVTANQFYGISNNNNTAGYIGVNAEL